MNINFEQDKQDSLTKVNDAKSLSEQVVKLQSMEEDLVKQEEQVNIHFYSFFAFVCYL